MPNPAGGSTEGARRAQELIAILRARANAVTTYSPAGDDTWHRRMASLQSAIADANNFFQEGSAPAEVRDSLQTTLQRVSHTVTSQFALLEEAPERTGGTSTPARPRRTGGGSAATPTSDPETASILPDWSGQWEEKGGPSDLWLWLNPPGAPLHRKPIVIGAAALGAAGLVYGIVKKVG